MINELFQGVQMNHKNNHTHTTREGHMLEEDFKILPIVEYTGKPTFLRMLSQGMYKIYIDEEWYIFMVHDILGPADFIRIDDQYNAVVVNNMVSNPLYLRKFNSGCDLRTDGFYLQNTVNDRLDMLVIDGLTKYGDDKYIRFDTPRKIEFTSMYNIQVKDSKSNKTEFVLSTKAYLKSMDVGYGGIYDRLYIESEIGRALFLFRLGRFIFSGYEPWAKIDKYCDLSYNVFYYPTGAVKLNSNIRCTHLKDYTFKELILDKLQAEGICAGGLEDEQGLFIKLRASDYPDYESLKQELHKWFTLSPEEAEQLNLDMFDVRNKSGMFESIEQYRKVYPVVSDPFTVVYELTNTEYRELALENYTIPTFFNSMHLLINPFEPVPFIRSTLGNLIAIIPKDNIIKTMKEQLQENNEEIIANNIIWELLLSTGEYSGHKRVDFTPDELVGVAPLNWDTAHAIKSSILQELESGNADKYDDILRENKIIRNIFAWALEGDDPMYDINHPTFVAVVPKDRSKNLQSVETQYQQTKINNMYTYIRASHDIISNLTVSAAYKIKASYFYKHLRIN